MLHRMVSDGTSSPHVDYTLTSADISDFLASHYFQIKGKRELVWRLESEFGKKMYFIFMARDFKVVWKVRKV